VELEDGAVLEAARDDYHGFHTDPFDWTAARAKFDRVTRAPTSEAEREAIADVVATFEHRRVAELTALLARVTSTTEPASLQARVRA
jgi:2-methylcitrate dehydratase